MLSSDRLEELILQRCSITSIAKLPKQGFLKSLEISNSRFDDEAIKELSEKTPKVKFLRLNHTLVSDAGLVHLHKLDHLFYLGVSDTKITDDGLLSLLDSCKKLRYFELEKSRITPKLELMLKKKEAYFHLVEQETSGDLSASFLWEM